MSKSKLNRRQLKKISKLAVSHLLKDSSRYKVLKDQISLDDGEEGFDGEFIVWQSTGFGDYDSYSALDSLFGSFRELHTNCADNPFSYWEANTLLPAGFESLSYANKVHYMIKFLEALNEQGND